MRPPDWGLAQRQIVVGDPSVQLLVLLLELVDHFDVPFREGRVLIFVPLEHGLERQLLHDSALYHLLLHSLLLFPLHDLAPDHLHLLKILRAILLDLLEGLSQLVFARLQNKFFLVAGDFGSCEGVVNNGDENDNATYNDANEDTDIRR